MDEHISQEPKMAMQIINKMLSGVDGKGVFVGMVTIGKLILNINGNGKVTTTEAEGVEFTPVDEPKEISGGVPEIENKAGLSFPQAYVKRRYGNQCIYSELAETVLRKAHPDWKKDSLGVILGVVRQFLKFTHIKKGNFELHEVTQEDVKDFLEAHANQWKRGTLSAKKRLIMDFFQAIEVQGIGKAIPSFTYCPPKTMGAEIENERG